VSPRRKALGDGAALRAAFPDFESEGSVLDDSIVETVARDDLA